jgi:hypothetical protein
MAVISVTRLRIASTGAVPAFLGADVGPAGAGPAGHSDTGRPPADVLDRDDVGGSGCDGRLPPILRFKEEPEPLRAGSTKQGRPTPDGDCLIPPWNLNGPTQQRSAHPPFCPPNIGRYVSKEQDVPTFLISKRPIDEIVPVTSPTGPCP